VKPPQPVTAKPVTAAPVTLKPGTVIIVDGHKTVIPRLRP